TVRQQKCREEPETLGTRRSAGLEFGSDGLAEKSTQASADPPESEAVRLPRIFPKPGTAKFFCSRNKSTDASQRARSFFALHQRRKFPELEAKTWGEPMRRKLRCPSGRATGVINPVAKQHEDSVK